MEEKKLRYQVTVISKLIDRAPPDLLDVPACKTYLKQKHILINQTITYKNAIH